MQKIQSKSEKNTNIKFPQISVQLLTCNSSKYLRECLDSIINQDYPNLKLS